MFYYFCAGTQARSQNCLVVPLLEAVLRPLFSPVEHDAGHVLLYIVTRIKAPLGEEVLLFLLCWDPGSNWGPFALQANALPTELSQHITLFSLLPLPYTKICICRQMSECSLPTEAIPAYINHTTKNFGCLILAQIIP